MNRRALVVTGAAVAVVAAAGAGFAVGAFVGGGGTQPEDVLPDTLVAFADVDLDPAAEQKLNLVRLLGRFPDVEDAYGEQPDLRRVVIDRLVQGTDLEGARVEDWVGDRVGIGLSWDAENRALTPVAALQATDGDEALADLGRVLDDDQMALADGYVIVSGDLFSEVPLVGGDFLPEGEAPRFPDSATAAEIVAAADTAPLAESSTFQDVFDRLDDGIMSMYVDAEALDGAAETLATDLGLDAFDGSTMGGGQTGAVLRAEPSALELLAWSSVDVSTSSTPAVLAEGLPKSTVLALEVTGGADAVARQWQSVLDRVEEAGGTRELERQLAELEAQYGLVVPDDLETLLGDDMVAAVDGGGLLTGVPGIGLRSVTDPASADDLARRLQRVLDPLTGGFGFTAQAVADGMVVATSQQFADRLEAGGGGLGSDPTYREALPDSGEAASLVWVDLATIRSFAQLAAPDASSVIEPLAGFGGTVTPDDGGSRIRLRLVFSDASDT